MAALLAHKFFCGLAVFAMVAILISAGASAQARQSLRFEGHVNDFARIISPDTKRSLGTLCQDLEKKGQAQISIVTVRSLNGESIEEYSRKLALHWGIAPDEGKRSVLIVVAPSQKKYQIEVGAGLKPILTEGLIANFESDAAAQFKIHNYSGAILLMTERVAAVIAKSRGVTLEALAQENRAPMGAETPPPPLTPRTLAVPLLCVVVLLFFPLLGLLLRRRAARRYGRGHGVIWTGAPLIVGGGGWGGGSWGGGGFGAGGGFGDFGGGSFGGGGVGQMW